MTVPGMLHTENALKEYD